MNDDCGIVAQGGGGVLDGGYIFDDGVHLVVAVVPIDFGVVEIIEDLFAASLLSVV